MLTPKLEELIFSGQAVYKTAAMGIGMAQAIVIPQNSYAVITDLTYSPFKDTDAGSFENLTNLINIDYINQIWIRSRLGNNHYIVRPSISAIHAQSSTHYITFNDVHFNTYLIHDGVIRFTLSHVESPQQYFNIDNSQLQDISNEESQGLGTASIAPSLTTIRKITFGAGGNYQPPTSVRDPQSAGNSGADQFRQKPYANQLLTFTSSTMAVPVLNVGYVQIQGKPAFLTS